MADWLLKTEPSTYSFADLQRDGKTDWDGVTNALALKHIRTMAPGDRAVIYHTGDEKSAVGLAEITTAARPDPKQNDPKLVVVGIMAKTPLKKPVPLAQLKVLAAFKDSPLVRIGRLSVVPLTAAQWKAIIQLGGN